MLYTSSNYSYFSASTALILSIYPRLFLVNNLTKFRKFLFRGCGSSSSSEKPSCINANAKHPLSPLPHPPSESRNIIPNDLSSSSIHVRNTPPLLCATLLLMSKPQGGTFTCHTEPTTFPSTSPRHFQSNMLNQLVESHVESSREAIQADLVDKIVYDDFQVFDPLGRVQNGQKFGNWRVCRVRKTGQKL